ncbi:hypothetical protein ACLOJK_009021 [Asimina triloba]
MLNFLESESSQYLQDLLTWILHVLIAVAVNGIAVPWTGLLSTESKILVALNRNAVHARQDCCRREWDRCSLDRIAIH